MKRKLTITMLSITLILIILALKSLGSFLVERSYSSKDIVYDIL